jgi:periplasmic protein CpxP/Spy
MKTLQRTLVAAGLLAAFGIGAIAQTQPAPAPAAQSMQGERGRHDPARMEQFRARMQERMAQRLGELKQKLQITGAQEGAWNAWTAAMKPTPHQRPDRAEFERLTTPERIDRMRAMRAQRGAEMDKRMDATKTFYATLNAEQKKVFDAEGLRFMRGGKRGGMGGHGGHGQRG